MPVQRYLCPISFPCLTFRLLFDPKKKKSDHGLDRICNPSPCMNVCHGMYVRQGHLNQNTQCWLASERVWPSACRVYQSITFRKSLFSLTMFCTTLPPCGRWTATTVWTPVGALCRGCLRRIGCIVTLTPLERIVGSALIFYNGNHPNPIVTGVGMQSGALPESVPWTGATYQY